MFNKRLIPIPGREFLSTPDEWHAFWIGAFEIMCPRKPREALGAPVAGLNCVQKEYHYYLMGRAVGTAILAFSLFGIAALVRACW